MGTTRVKANELDIIYTMYFLANQTKADISRALGRSDAAVSNITAWMKAAQTQDANTMWSLIDSGRVGTAIVDWAAQKLDGFELPARPEAQSVDDDSEYEQQEIQITDSNEDKFLLKIIEEQARTNAALRATKELQDSYLHSMINMIQAQVAYSRGICERLDKILKELGVNGNAESCGVAGKIN